MIDIFGKALKGYLNGDSSSYTIRRADGNYCHINTCEYFSDYEEWSNCERELIIKHTNGGERILDVGAGAGRHSLFLKNRNIEVHSLDNSPFAANLLKIRGLNNVYLMDLREMNFPDNYFDSVLMISNDLGLAGTIKDTKRLFKTLFRIVKPDGKIIAIIRDSGRYKSDAPESFVYNNHKRKLAKIVDKIRLRLEYNDTVGDWFYSIMASPEELKKLIRDTGWLVADIVAKDGDGFYGAMLKKEKSSLKVYVENNQSSVVVDKASNV